MSRTNEKAAGVLDTLATAKKKTHVDSTPDSKTLATVAAQFAIKGHALHAHNKGDTTTFSVSRWNQSKHFAAWVDVLAFLKQIGGAV